MVAGALFPSCPPPFRSPGYITIPAAIGSYNGGAGQISYLAAPVFPIYTAAAPSSSPSASPSMSASQSPSPSTTAVGQLFRALPRMDLVGTPVGAAAFFAAVNEAACRSMCVSTPGCDAYAFSVGALSLLAANFVQLAETAPCCLYANVTSLVPSSLMTSGVLLARYS